MDFMIYVVFV